MNRVLARLLQVAVVLVGLLVLAFLLVEPHFEGRNTHSTVFQVYFNDPFLAFVYVGSIPFFVALFHAFREFGYAATHGVFSPAAASVLRTIKYCAIAIIGFVAVAEVIIMNMPSDDRAGGVAMGVLVTFGCVAVALAATFLERARAAR